MNCGIGAIRSERVSFRMIAKVVTGEIAVYHPYQTR
jgi:hypothetical protein